MVPNIMRDAIEAIAERLQDNEYRMEYGEAAKIDFAIALTFARQERGMTQQEMADLLGVSKAYVVRLESGDGNPSIAKAGRIFAALWLKPIDKPFPLLEGYGPYETSPSAEDCVSVAADAVQDKSTRKAKR